MADRLAARALSAADWLRAGGYCNKTCGVCACVDDVPPHAALTCGELRVSGRCQAAWVLDGNYCQRSCGRCGAAESWSRTSLLGREVAVGAGARPPPAAPAGFCVCLSVRGTRCGARCSAGAGAPGTQHDRNKDPTCGCQIGTRCPILIAK
jgi:hypothetical protein